MIYALVTLCALLAFVTLQHQIERDKWRIERQELANRIQVPGIVAWDRPKKESPPAEEIPLDSLYRVGMDVDPFESENGNEGQ